MANADLPIGARPYKTVMRMRTYRADAAVGQGDLVKQKAGDGSGTGLRIDVEPSTTGGASIGVAAHAASAGDDVAVYDHPDQIYEMQADGSDIGNADDIGKNYDIIATTGSMEIDSSSRATTATLPLKLMAVINRIDNALGLNVKCAVKINNHQLAGATGTAGV